MKESMKQLTKDIRTLTTKLKKLSVKSWLVVSLFVFLSVSLLAALYVSQKSAEDRSGASGGGPEYYFSPAAVVLTQNEQGVLQPVQNIQIRSTAGRPVVSYSFVMRITDAQGQPVDNSVWDQLEFTPNQNFVSYTSNVLGASAPGAKLFVGTIGQQPGGTTTLTSAVTSGELGHFTFSPAEDQEDLRMSFYAVPGKPQANSLYVLGSIMNPPSADGEIQIPQEDFNNSFSLHNPFNVEPTAPPEGNDIDAAWFWYKSSNLDDGQFVAAKFDDYNVGGTLQTFTDLDHIDPIWRNSSLAPAFRIRVKKPDGTYRTTIINNETTDVLVESNPRGSFIEGNFWANWKVTAGTTTPFQLTLPNTTYSLPIARGDMVEATVNLKRIDNGIVYNCTENSRIKVYPLGQPEQQRDMGPCTNRSKVSVEYATPEPTSTPEPPPADTYRVTIDYAIHPSFMTYFNNYCPNSGATTVSGVEFDLLDIPLSCVVNAQPKQIGCHQYDAWQATSNGQIGTVTFDVLRNCSDLTGHVAAIVQSCDRPGLTFTSNTRDITINRDLTLSISVVPDGYTALNCHGPTITPTAIP